MKNLGPFLQQLARYYRYRPSSFYQAYAPYARRTPRNNEEEIKLKQNHSFSINLTTEQQVIVDANCTNYWHKPMLLTLFMALRVCKTEVYNNLCLQRMLLKKLLFFFGARSKLGASLKNYYVQRYHRTFLSIVLFSNDA